MGEPLAELTAALNAGRPCAFCAVVATRGSTPQKPGAAMLVFADGSQAGTLGGGCIEAEVKQRALGLLLAAEQADAPAGRREVQTFHLDDLNGWDDGLICGGRMTILAHALPAGVGGPAADYYRRLHALAEAGQGFTQAIVVKPDGPLAAGDRYLFDAQGNLVACLADLPSPEAVAAQLPPLTVRRRCVTRHGVAYLPSPPRITLLLVGGGHVSHALAPLAAQADFRVWILDDREAYANPQRFPCAERILVGPIGPTLTGLAPALTPATYAVVMTRGHNHDEEALGHLVESACGYVGMLGSRRKVRLIFADLISHGARPEDLRRVRSPVGLDIGSQTVHEIAVSIVSELIASRNLGPEAVPRAPRLRRKAAP
jgi:xanthine dehydrogenase accessory factor